MGDERCERCSTWSHAVSRQTHGASSFPTIRAARPGALVAMGQAVDHVHWPYVQPMACHGHTAVDSGIVVVGNFG